MMKKNPSLLLLFQRNVFLWLFCMSNIISFTSPQDPSPVSKICRSTVNSDGVWHNIFPAEYSSLIHPSKTPCDDIVLIEDGKMSLCLDKGSGQRYIMLSATEIDLSFNSRPPFWQWISIPESRFDKVAQLIRGCPFKIQGVMKARYLTPRICYSAYIVYKPRQEYHGFQGYGVALIVHRTPEGYTTERTELKKVEKREDGWMEIELGKFFNQGGGLMNNDYIEVWISEINYVYWNVGFIIQGIEFRPVKRWKSLSE